MFVGRKRELEQLQDAYDYPGSGFIIVYGRRRVGKTELLNRFAADKKAMYHACTESTDLQQMRDFRDSLLRAGAHAEDVRDWAYLFKSVLGIAPNPNGKKVAIIDEFPYMAAKNGSVPSILQNLWDGVFSKENVLLILCGSSVSFIEEEILGSKNPLYGRMTGIIKLAPLPFRDSVKLLGKYSDTDKVKIYAMTGGIPFYLSLFAKHGDVEKAVKKELLHSGSVLYNEAEFLLKQELRDLSVYNALIKAIALGCTKIGEISQSAMVGASAASPYLQTLAELGIVTKEYPVGTGPRGNKNPMRGVYRISDPFFRTWYTFVFPFRTLLDSGGADIVYDTVVKDRLNMFASIPFENICREYLMSLNIRGELPFVFTDIGRWWDKKGEIDIVAVDITGKKIIAGECKFKSAVFNLSEYMDAVSMKMEDAEVFRYMFSANGFEDGIAGKAGKDGVVLVTLKDIIAEAMR